MNTEVVHYVVYVVMSAGISGQSPRQIIRRDKRSCIKRAPSRAIGFYFCDVPTWYRGSKFADPDLRINVSPMYYIDAEVKDIAAIKAMPGNHHDLLAGMRRDKVEFALYTRTEVFVIPDGEHELVSAA